MTPPDLLQAVAGCTAVLVDGEVGGSQLRLVVQPDDERRIAAALESAGFSAVGDRWARFSGADSQTLRLTAVPDLVLPAEDARALLAEADEHPLGGPLRQPSARHALLLAAARLAEGRAPAAALRAEAVALFAAGTPARLAAMRRAQDWGLVRALAHLERISLGGDLTPADRADARRELWQRRGVDLPLVEEGFVVAFSGLDGSGKSLQATYARATLQALGYDVTVEWSRLAASPLLDRAAAPVKRLLGRRSGSPTAPPAAAQGADPARESAADLRRRNPAVAYGWSTVVAAANVTDRRRTTHGHLSQGRVVVCDRYTLDSVVQLRIDYANHAAAQTALLARGVRTPLAAFLLDVDAEEALRRKREQYDAAQLGEQAALYRSCCAGLGVHRLDGAQAAEAIAEQVAHATWAALGRC